MEARSAGHRRVVRRGPSRGKAEHIRWKKSPRKQSLSQSAALIPPLWDARFSAAFANQCPPRDTSVAQPISSPRRRRSRAIRSALAQAACTSSGKAAVTIASPQLVTVTHPFHPLTDRRLVCVGERHNRQGKRFLLRTDEGAICSVPPQWTDAAPLDPEVVIGRGRALFRIADLLGLARLVEQLSTGRRKLDV